MPSRPHKRKLIALLVAINDYPPPVTPLQGCVNDLEKIAAYLQKESDYFEVSIRKLINKEATKAAIVDQFQNHLGQASREDVVLFYYSGHGTQEEADPLFWPIEEDRKHEALVCFDSYTMENGEAKVNLLADKELRFLIHGIARNLSHILTVFDCCHSGGNTRNAYVSGQAEGARERRFINRARLSQAFPVRDWKDFIFSGVVPYENALKQTVVQLLPEGKHIQMAACQHDQSAFEVKGEGVFTKNLIEVLTRSEGAVTYYDLQSCIQLYLKNQFDQTPRIYSAGADESALFQGFLGKAIDKKPLYGNVSYNQELGWIVDLGAMHGISSQSPGIKVSAPGGLTYRAKIREVYAAYTQIIFEADQPDTTIFCKGYLTDYFSHPIGVFLDIEDDTTKGKLLQLLSRDNHNVHMMEAAYQADYCVRYAGQQLCLTRPGRPQVPVVRPVEYISDDGLHIMQNYLRHLAQFEFVKNLHNPNAYLFREEPVEVTVLKRSSQQEEKVPLMYGELFLEAGQTGQAGQRGSIRIMLKNTTDRKLYCALLYLSFNFGINVKLLKEVVVGLAPNHEVWALDGALIGLTLEEEIIPYNYKESTSFLKLIVSTSDFRQQVARFEMAPLPGPLASATRGFDLGVDPYNPGNIEDWTTRLITVRIKNPGWPATEEQPG